jgi:peptidyl-prolyl cis-trans isomerase C
MPPAFIEQYKTQIRQQALERMVVEKLLDQEVKQINLQVADEEVMKKIEEMAAQQSPPLSMEDFKALIEAYGQSLEEVKERIRKGSSYQKIVEAQFEGKISITEEDAKKFYDENPKEFETPEQVRASHILIAIKPTDSNDVKAEAKQKIEQLLKQVQDDADFAQLAKENSTCPSSEKGGDLGFFGKGQMVPAFEKVAFELKPGQVSDVVETRFGYHIIKVADRKDASTKSFEEEKDGIINNLENKKKGEIAKQYIESLKAQAKIVYPPGKEPKTPPTPPAMTP